MSVLNARLFGFPTIDLDGQALHIEPGKALALLSYLLAAGPTCVYQPEDLALLFWPELEPTRALASLGHVLGDIDQVLGDGWIEKDKKVIGWHPDKDCWIDVLEFRALLDKGNTLSLTDPYGGILILLEAVALYRGDFMNGFTLGDNPSFDRWLREQAETLRNKFSGLLSSLAKIYGQVGEHDAAIACARRWLALDPLNQQAHRLLMLRYEAAGQRLAALRQYDECVRLLRKERGIVPESATRTMYEGILARKSASAISHAAQSHIPVTPPGITSLPVVATPFIGREPELEKIAALLSRPDCRLVSLIGPGGIGKTRVALQAARMSFENGKLGPAWGTLRTLFQDGVFFIPLADAGSTAAMLKIIADTLGCPFREDVNTPAGLADNRLRLMHFLSVKKCMLVLDNLEHLHDGAGLAGEICTASPGVKILTTSRHRLNLAQEWVVELDGMPVPGDQERDSLGGYTSVQLFLQGAARAMGDFHPAPQDWSAIGRICQLVDGMPLAIELAAAWVRVFSPPEIAKEIERNLDFLSTTAQGVPERHQSLRAVFEYSWRLLPERERSAVRRLSIFRGGFNREMAGRVAGAALPLLASLVDRCLVRRSPSGRYELHEVVKQYARLKLTSEPGEEAEALNFHSETYLDLLVEIGEQLKGAGQEEGLRLLESELENIELAWERAVELADIQSLLRALPALILAYEMSNQWTRGCERLDWTRDRFEPSLQGWLDRLRQGEKPEPGAEDELILLALLLAGWKRFSATGGVPIPIISQCYAKAMELLSVVSNRREKAYSLILLNSSPVETSPEKILGYIQSTTSILEAEGDRWGMALAWLILADIHNLVWQEAATARQAYATSLSHFVALGNDWGRAVCYNGLGIVAFREGNYREARSLWVECVAVFRRIQNLWRELEARLHLAEACERDGAFEEAAMHYDENARLYRSLGELRPAAWHLGQLARAELACGKTEQASEHYAQAMAIFHQIGDLDGTRQFADLSL